MAVLSSISSAADEAVLVFNAGSSSLKFSVYCRRGTDGWRLEARGQIDGIGGTPRLSVRDGDGACVADEELDAGVRNGKAVLGVLLDWIRSRFAGVRVAGVGHRVVHGGSRHLEPCIVTPEVLEGLRTLVPLAPLHQPHNLDAIEAVAAALPGARQVACFDTSFHRGIPEVAQLVPLPRRIRDRGVERYGFHGLSYEYVASVLPELAPGIATGKVVVAHLGNGASLCALRDRKSVDHTLGFTALDGLCMGTRPGSLDPGVVLYLIQALRMTASEVESLLYEESGLAGISGVSNDMRDLLGSAEPAAKLAVEYFVYQVGKHMGALASVLGGIDAIVFTAGIGEHSPEIRARVCRACEWMGVRLDEHANAANGPRISPDGAPVSAWVIATNEERMIARHMGTLLGLTGGLG